jgi:hypothetical protein
MQEFDLEESRNESEDKDENHRNDGEDPRTVIGNSRETETVPWW